MMATSPPFIFVHVPKTGGNSIQNILRRYSSDEIVAKEPYQDGVERFEVRNPTYGFAKHSPLSEYRDKLPAEIYARSFRFACVRNPWEWVVSYYFSPHRQVSGFDRESFVEFIRSAPPMTYFLRDRPAQPLAEVAHNFDLLMRYETLQADFDAACDRLGVPRQMLPRVNASTRGRVEDYYDEETVELVRSRFAEDVELLGYDVPWAGRQYA
jgi:hypothetical protein